MIPFFCLSVKATSLSSRADSVGSVFLQNEGRELCEKLISYAEALNAESTKENNSQNIVEINGRKFDVTVYRSMNTKFLCDVGGSYCVAKIVTMDTNEETIVEFVLLQHKHEGHDPKELRLPLY